MYIHFLLQASTRNEPHLTLNICHFAGQKRQYNEFLQGNLLDSESFDQLLLLKKVKEVTENVGRTSL